MTINGVCCGSKDPITGQDKSGPVEQEIKKLTQVLQNNDLNGAQQAKLALEKFLSPLTAGGNSTPGSQQANRANALNSDLTVLGKNLQLKHISSAKNDLRKLVENLQKVRNGIRIFSPYSESKGQNATSNSSDSASQTAAGFEINGLDSSRPGVGSTINLSA